MSTQTLNTEKLTSDLKSVVNNAEDLIHAIGDQATGKAAEAKARLKHAIANAKVTCEDLQQRAREGAKAADRVVRDHPYQSIGIAVAAGLVLGLLIGRK
jgi:ElaB/YqjD/DUF883 family membrane-anchored ribosome-binding protein